MATRLLIIDSVTRTKIAHVVSYAEENPYHPGIDPIPGHVKGYTCWLRAYKCVFTHTRMKGKKFRHLSISVPAPDKYPNSAAAFTLATEFGFTGWDGRTLDRIPESWGGGVKESENCLVFIQEIKDSED